MYHVNRCPAGYKHSRVHYLVSGVHHRPLPQAQDSVGDIRSDAVGPGDHHASAEPVLPAHGHGQQATAEQRILRRVPDNRLAGRVLPAVLRRVHVRVAVRRVGLPAPHPSRRQVAVVRADHRVGAVQRAAVRHQKQAAEEDVPELPAEDDDQVRGEPGDPGADAVGVRIPETVADAGVRVQQQRGVQQQRQGPVGGDAPPAVVRHEPGRARRAPAAPGRGDLGQRPELR